WSGERLERVSEIHVKDEKGGEEAGETGKPEPVSGIEDDEELAEENEGAEIGPPTWLKWMLTVTSYVLLMAIVFVATWMFFPRPEFCLIDVYRWLVSRAPVGTHFSSDGTVSIPGLTEAPGPSWTEKGVQPPAQPPR